MRVGVIGSSAVTGWHLRALRSLPEVELVGLCGSHDPSVTRLSARHQVRAVDDVPALLRLGPELVLITSETARHAALAAAVLPHVRGVVVEKPLAETLAEAERLAALADTHRSTLCVVSQYRFDPNLQRLAALALAEDAPVEIRIDVRRRRDEHGGRPPRSLLATQLPHWLDLALELSGTPFDTVEIAAGRDGDGRCDHLLALLRNARATVQLAVAGAHPVDLPPEIDLHSRQRSLRTRNFVPWADSLQMPAADALQHVRRDDRDIETVFALMHRHFVQCLNSPAERVLERRRALQVMRLLQRISDLVGEPLA